MHATVSAFSIGGIPVKVFGVLHETGVHRSESRLPGMRLPVLLQLLGSPWLGHFLLEVKHLGGDAVRSRDF